MQSCNPPSHTSRIKRKSDTWATPLLGDTNTGTWLCTLVVGRKAGDLALQTKLLKNAVFCDVVPCGFIINRRFGGKCRLHLQGKKYAGEEKYANRLF
jgi:hypothetical protein